MIRRATVSDIPVLQNLLGQILRVHHEARPDLFKAEGGKFTDDELATIIASDQTPVFVYENEAGAVIGHLFLQVIEVKSAVLNPIKTLFIDDLCVDEAARGQRIGQDLYSFAVAYAKELGCYNLTLNVWNDNVGALRFYQNQGMTAQETKMEVILP